MIADCFIAGDESLGEEPLPSSTPPVADSASTAHLQRCLRLNVDRFGGEALNTLSVSRCVRELLSVNNIGQRLFAKLVLGLSQGTRKMFHFIPYTSLVLVLKQYNSVKFCLDITIFFDNQMFFCYLTICLIQQLILREIVSLCSRKKTS